MYDASLIKAGLIGLIGWRQNEDTTSELQLTDLTSTTSGLYYNDEHPLLTFGNLQSIAPEYDALNDKTQANLQSRFTAWLKRKTEAGILRAIDRWYNEKSKLKTAKGLLANNVVYKNTSTNTSLDTDNSKIVGHIVDLRPSQSLRVTIDRLSIQLTQNQTLTVSLYETGQATAIQSEDFVYNASGSVQWFTPADTWELEGNKTYFIAYDQSTLTGQSVNSVQGQYGEFITCARVVRFTTFETDTLSPEQLAGNLATGNSTNYGLNYQLSAKCDYTQFILDQKDLFKTAISKQVAIDMLRELAYNANTQENRNTTNVNYQQIMYEIDGDSTGVKKSGLEMQLQRALNAIQFDYTGIDSVCLPCKRRGIKIKSL